MTILALEFSSPQRSVAVARIQAGKAQAATEVVETGGRGTNVFGMIERVLAQAKIEREEIDAIAIGLGPGSYTGIRSAIAIAQGWQLALGTKLAGISSADCLAAQAQSEHIFGCVNVVIDAQRNEFYAAAHEISEAERKEIRPLKILTFAELQSRADSREILVGPEVTRWFPNGKDLFPRAAALANLVSDKNNFVPGEKLEPIYLRVTSFVKASPSSTVVF
ncbi:MAG: tRNA (adenosine(37)-N6)-threonylcarbamoyltransferase complex dimerization subunit type 1 TsaB [Verrucomicrobiota bacterium]|jgi:tRNA threonylcarbamoyladenosine biosynthesis protein TsaB